MSSAESFLRNLRRLVEEELDAHGFCELVLDRDAALPGVFADIDVPGWPGTRTAAAVAIMVAEMLQAAGWAAAVRQLPAVDGGGLEFTVTRAPDSAVAPS